MLPKIVNFEKFLLPYLVFSYDVIKWDNTKRTFQDNFRPVIALSFQHFCPKLEQTLHRQQEQHSWQAGNIFFLKKCIERPKNAIFMCYSRFRPTM